MLTTGLMCSCLDDHDATLILVPDWLASCSVVELLGFVLDGSRDIVVGGAVLSIFDRG